VARYLACLVAKSARCDQNATHQQSNRFATAQGANPGCARLLTISCADRICAADSRRVHAMCLRAPAARSGHGALADAPMDMIWSHYPGPLGVELFSGSARGDLAGVFA
jgi:hypothetical protein